MGPVMYYPTAAERLAASAWKRLNLSPPVDLQTVCDFLKVPVIKLLLAPDLRGIYLRATNGEAEIRVNSGILPLERQRFTWAHEIGHHLLTRKLPGQIVVEFRTNKKNPLERECDRFAVCLLMPVDEVKKHAVELGHPKYHDKTGTLAARFGVSVTAMSNRLRELGLERVGHRR